MPAALLVLNNSDMKKRLLKRSDVLREGYVKGLRKAQRIIAEMLQTADGRTIQNDARAWVDCYNIYCFENDCEAALVFAYDSEHDYDRNGYRVDSVKYDAGNDRIVVKAIEGRTGEMRTFYINDALEVVHGEEVDEIAARHVDVETPHGVMNVADVCEGVEYIAFYGCPEFSDAFPRYGSGF